MEAWEGLDATGVISRLLVTAQQIQAHLDSTALKNIGLTLAQLQVLRLVAAHDGIQPSQLSKALGCTRGNITGIVNRLCREGLIERHPGAADRRTVHLHLTPRAADLLGRESGIAAACQELLSTLTTNERAVLLSLLERLDRCSWTPESAAAAEPRRPKELETRKTATVDDWRINGTQQQAACGYSRPLGAECEGVVVISRPKRPVRIIPRR